MRPRVPRALRMTADGFEFPLRKVGDPRPWLFGLMLGALVGLGLLVVFGYTTEAYVCGPGVAGGLVGFVYSTLQRPLTLRLRGRRLAVLRGATVLAEAPIEELEWTVRRVGLGGRWFELGCSARSVIWIRTAIAEVPTPARGTDADVPAALRQRNEARDGR